MAIENVKKFFELVKSDEELAREIAKIKDEIQNKGETVDYEQIISKKVIPLAKKHGLDFTMEDFLKYTNSMVQQGELSDDDLLNVSGGMNFRQGLATGLLMLTVGTTGLSLMGNLQAPGGGDSGSGGQGMPGTSYSQSIDNGAEDEEVVDTENDEREDNDFYDEDDITPAAEGASMDMLGAGVFDASEDETDTQGGAGKSVSTNKDATGGGAGTAKSTTATKAKSDGAGAGGAAGATTIAEEDYGRFEDFFDDSFWGTDKADSATTTTTAAKKDEAKTEASAKKEVEEAAKKAAEEKAAAEEVAKKAAKEEKAKTEADAVEKVEYTGLKRDALTLKSFADKVETVNEVAKALKESENGKNMTAESRAKLEADTLKLGFVLYDVKTQSFDVQGDDWAALFEDGDEANIHAVENYYKEISGGLEDFNDTGKTPYQKAENLVNNLNKVNGEWYRFSPKTVKTVAQRINDAGARVGQDDNGWFFNDGWVRNTQNRSSFDEGELKMIKTAADELANLAKK